MKNVFQRFTLLTITMVLVTMVSVAQWVQTNGPYGGSVNCFAVNGTNLYAGTDAGVFLSTDYGTSWSQISSGLEGFQIISLAAAPDGKGGNFLFAGGMDNSTFGGAIFRSDNNGASWTKMFVDSLDRAHFGSEVLSLLVRSNQANGTSIFAGCDHTGIYRSTDYGSNWNRVYPSPDLTSFGTVPALASSDDDILAINGVFLLRSTDNGTSWVENDSGITGYSSLSPSVIAIKDRNIFLGMSNTNTSNTLGILYFSTDHGNSWSRRDSGIIAHAIKSFAISGSYIFAATDSGVFLSTDNGTSWAARNSGIENLKVGPLTFVGTRVFAGTNHGVFLSTNYGSSWTPAAGLLPLSVSALSTNGTDLFAGTYRGVYFSSDKGNNWVPKNSGWQDNLVNALVNSSSNIFAGTDNGVFVSTDNGSNWGERDTGIVKNYSYSINALAVNGTNLFAGGGFYREKVFINGRFMFMYHPGMYISSNNGMNWAKIDSGLTGSIDEVISLTYDLTGGGLGTLYATTVQKYEATPDSSSGIYRSTNNGTTWSRINTLNLPMNTVRVLGIVPNGKGGTNLIAPYFAWIHTIYGYCYNGANISTDAGATWNAITISPEISIVHCFTTKGGNIFAGTNRGIFVSNDGGWNWSSINSGLTNLNVESLLIKDEYLYAGAGDGVWRRPLSEITAVKTQSNESPKEFSLQQNYPNPFNPSTVIRYELPSNALVSLKVYDVLGREIESLVNERQSAGIHSVTFHATKLQSGVYFYRIQAGNYHDTKKLLLLK